MKKSAFISAAILLIGATAGAQVSVTAKLDSVEAVQGGLRLLDVEIVQPAGAEGSWVIDRMTADARQGEGRRAMPVEIAPGVELHTKGAPDTTKLDNGRIQINRQLLIQPFDSGDVIIPGLQFIVGADTFRSKDLALKVYTPDVDTMTVVHDMLGTVAAPSHFWDWVPDWIADYWWVYLLAIIVIAGAVTGWYLYHKGGLKALVKPAPKPVPPYEKAISQLEILRQRKLCEKGQEKEFYTELTEILRQYLEGRFGINAMEMTSTQIRQAVKANSTTRDMSAQMNQILEMADFVKFAKMRPLPEDNVRTFSHAMQFVENTKPLPEAAAEGETAKEGGEARNN